MALEVGTLGAVCLYFGRDIWAMLAGLGRAMKGRRDRGATLAGYLAAATIPVFVAGFVFDHFYPNAFRGLIVIAWTMFGFGIVLYLADKFGMTLRRIEHLRAADAVVNGIAQVLALIPGTSRSGITMSAARILGFERADSARFSMLLCVPWIVQAAAVDGYHLLRSGGVDLTTDAMIAAGCAFVSAFIALAMMMAWLRRATFAPFVFYRIVVGGLLLIIAYDLVPPPPWW